MKQLTICITGSIAAYKIPSLIDQLNRYPITIYVAMTTNSQSFVSPLTLEVLSKNKVVTNMVESQVHASVDHIFLAI